MSDLAMLSESAMSTHSIGAETLHSSIQTWHTHWGNSYESKPHTQKIGSSSIQIGWLIIIFLI